MGYESYQEWDEGRSWKKDETYLVFVQAPADADLAFDRRDVGLNHLAFHAESRGAVDDLKTELEERGVRILYADRHPDASSPNYYALFFEDPDGIKVEVVAEHPLIAWS